MGFLILVIYLLQEIVYFDLFKTLFSDFNIDALNKISQKFAH